MVDLYKLAEFLDRKISLASQTSFAALANVAKATGGLARMSNLFDATGPIDIYEQADSPKPLIAMLDNVARNLYMKAYQKGAGRSEVAGAMAKMMDLVEKIHTAAANTKGNQSQGVPLDPSFWAKLDAVKSAMNLVIPMDIYPQVPVVRPTSPAPSDNEPDGNARKQSPLTPELTDVVHNLMADKEKKNPWEYRLVNDE